MCPKQTALSDTELDIQANIGKYMRFITAILVLLTVIGSASAQSTSSLPSGRVSRPADEKPVLKPRTEDRYRLVPGDVIEVTYRYTPEFNQTVTIQPDGYVGLQIVGDLKLGGQTLQEAQQKIAEKASARLKEPEVNLFLREFQKPYIVVSGEVANAGRIELRENITALQAILMSGGFKESAKSNQIVVFRRLNAEFAEVRILNLKSISKTSDLENDLSLRSGDIVFVPRSTLSKIERIVRIAALVPMMGPLGSILR